MLSNLLVVTLPLIMQLPGLDAGSIADARPPMSVVAESLAPARSVVVVRQAKAMRFVLAIDGNEARYRVREQLAGIDFPSDAVGKTDRVEGSLLIGVDGRIVRDSSRFTIDLPASQGSIKERA